MNAMYEFIKNMPKAELHVHFDGTLEPEQLLLFAERNKIKIPYATVDDVQKSRQFTKPQEFYDAYNIATSVLATEEDFYDLMWAYLEKVATQGVKHAEVIFDTQTYTARGIQAQSVINPLSVALHEAEKKWGMTGSLILCFLRHLSEQGAFESLHASLAYKDKISAVGLAANEIGNPACKFERVFAQARAYGYHRVAHAGEHCGPESIRQAIDFLKVERVDHGVRCLEDVQLVEDLRVCQMSLTVCPLSNRALQVYPVLREHPVKEMIDASLAVSLHSDDPAYFGGYIGDNYLVAFTECGLTLDDLILSAKNSFNGSFISQELKAVYLKQLDDYVDSYRDILL